MRQNSDPTVSVVVITYNQQNYISQTLEGIFNQVVDFNFELIISDDCSSDETVQVIEKLLEKNENNCEVHFERNTENVGMVSNWYDSLAKCRGKYIAICEGDDYWLSSAKLSCQVELLDSRPDISVCGHLVQRVDAEGDYVDRYGEPGEFAFDQVLSKYPFSTPSLMFRRPDGGFDLSLRKAGTCDWPTVLFVMQRNSGSLALIMPDVLGAYRIHQGGVWSMNQGKRQGQMILANIEFYLQHLDLTTDQVNRLELLKKSVKESYFLYDYSLTTLLSGEVHMLAYWKYLRRRFINRATFKTAMRDILVRGKKSNYSEE